MDTSPTTSAREAAARLGTSLPRIKRAIRRLGLPVAERPGGRVRLTGDQVDRLRAELGADAPVAGLTKTEARVLAALARSPLGVSSIRVAAGRAGVSPTAAGHALRSLERQGLVVREHVWVTAGRARRIEIVRADVTSPRWPELALRLARIVPPAAECGAPRDRRVPGRLRHLFWNTAPGQLDVERAGSYIARRLISMGDVEGLAWGADHLGQSDWLHAARTRGLDGRARAMALNLATQAGGGR